MTGGELFFYFSVTVVVTALVSVFVLWRYRVLVLAGMNSAEGQAAPVPAPGRRVPRHAASIEADDAAGWERAVHRRVIAAWLISAGIAALVWAWLYLANVDLSLSPAHVTPVVGASLGAAAPMISVSLAWPFWRGVRFWLWTLAASAFATVIVSALQRLFKGEIPTPDQLLNAVFFLQLSVMLLWLPALILLVIGSPNWEALTRPLCAPSRICSVVSPRLTRNPTRMADTGLTSSVAPTIRGRQRWPS